MYMKGYSVVDCSEHDSKLQFPKKVCVVCIWRNPLQKNLKEKEVSAPEKRQVLYCNNACTFKLISNFSIFT